MRRVGNSNFLIAVGFLLFFLVPFSALRPVTYASLQDLFICFLFVILSLRQRDRLWRYERLGFAVLFLTFVSLISIQDVESLEHHFYNTAKIACTFILFPYCIFVLGKEVKIWFVGNLGFISGVLVSAIVALLNEQANYDRFTGLSGHAVLQGFLSALAATLLLLSFSPNSVYLKYLQFAIFLFFLWCVSKTVSVTSVLVLVMGLGMYIFQEKDKRTQVKLGRKSLIITIIVLLSIQTGWFSATGQRYYEQLKPSRSVSLQGWSGQSTIQIRQLTYSEAFREIKQRPLTGKGFDLSGQYLDIGFQPHNLLLLAWLSGGLLFFLTCTVVLVLISKLFFLALRVRRNDCALAFGATILIYMTSSVFYESAVPALALLAWVELKKHQSTNEETMSST